MMEGSLRGAHMPCLLVRYRVAPRARLHAPIAATQRMYGCSASPSPRYRLSSPHSTQRTPNAPHPNPLTRPIRRISTPQSSLHDSESARRHCNAAEPRRPGSAVGIRLPRTAHCRPSSSQPPSPIHCSRVSRFISHPFPVRSSPPTLARLGRFSVTPWPLVTPAPSTHIPTTLDFTTRPAAPLYDPAAQPSAHITPPCAAGVLHLDFIQAYGLNSGGEGASGLITSAMVTSVM